MTGSIESSSTNKSTHSKHFDRIPGFAAEMHFSIIVGRREGRILKDKINQHSLNIILAGIIRVL